jgi:hypothetical protein
MDFGSNQGQGTYLFPSAFEPATYPMGTGDVIPGIKGPARGNRSLLCQFYECVELSLSISKYLYGGVLN